MIDYEKLNQAYENQRFYSLQIEVGDLCYQGCIYCYMNALDIQKNTLSDQQIQNLLKDAHKMGITAIEWLGGEPLLRHSIFEHMAMCADLGMRNNVWTGGLPLKKDEILKKTAKYTKYGLIAIHVSTVDPEIYQKLHPGHSRKELEIILKKIRKLLDLGYPYAQLLNSVTFTGLQASADMIKTIDYFENEFNVKTCVNVYHTYLRPGFADKELERFIPTSSGVKKVYKRYAAHWGVKEFPMNCVNKQYCSTTVAVLCDGSVTPCATIREDAAPNIHQENSFYDIVHRNIDYLTLGKFRDSKNLPESCQACELSNICFGCRSRAYAAGNGIYGKDIQDVLGREFLPIDFFNGLKS
jgi:radical SAM protein with 4Fe4S-binding SPASM domain